MAGLRKASAYSHKRVRPFTRKSAKKNRAYIKAVPPNKIVKFNMGQVTNSINSKFKYQVRLVSEEKVQVRDTSLEACRMAINKALDVATPGNYHFVVKVFPHHVLRENKAAGGVAGADRLSHGMKHSYGVTIGRAAIVNPGKDIFVVTTPDENSARSARNALNKIRSKLPCKSRVVFEKTA